MIMSWLGQVKIGPVKFRSCFDTFSHVLSRNVWSGHVRSWLVYLVRAGHNLSCAVRQGQVCPGQISLYQIRLYLVKSGHILSGQHTSCMQDRSCLVRSGHALSCLALCLVMSRQVTSCLVFFCLIWSDQVMSCKVRSCHVFSVQVMSGLVRSGHVLSGKITSA